MNYQIKFRAWDKYGKYLLSSLGEEYAQEPNMHYNCGLSYDISHLLNNPDRFLVEQFTGLKDINGKEIYEGDIVKFRYWVGDFAWEEMSPEEVFKNTQMLDHEYIGQVCRDFGSVNMSIICGNRESTHLNFPLAYAAGAVIIGNVFENPELIKNEKSRN